jgi:aspartate kinase
MERADTIGVAMPLVVQKYGGSSLRDAQDLARCARLSADAHRAQDAVVVVVSAMGTSTDDLLGLAQQVGSQGPSHELDQLLATGEQVSMALMTMALRAEGLDAVGLSGTELGLVTDEVHGNARIRSIEVGHVRAALNAGRIPVIAGFQGVAPNGQITTLGRGGSDATAVAIASGLAEDGRGDGGAAVQCQIATDVDGIYTADPRIVPTSRRLARIGYDDLLELSSLGARVVQAKAVQLARQHNVQLVVRRSPSRGGGDGRTIVGPGNHQPVVGAALQRCPKTSHAIVSIVGAQLGGQRELLLWVRQLLGQHGIDVIEAQCAPRSLSWIVPMQHAHATLGLVHDALCPQAQPQARITLVQQRQQSMLGWAKPSA